MATRSNQRRAERALAEFRRRLEGLDAEEVRSMLDRRRVRSPERVAMARQRLAQLEGGGPARLGAAAAAARPADGEGRPVRRNGHRADEAERAVAEIGGVELPLARPVGRMLGIGLGIVGLAALALLIVRR